jgi:serine/threonine protein kinase
VPLSSGARLGPYEIQAAIGAGGMGEVYKARDTRLDRTVAIKVLPAELNADPERRARFEREARAVAALSHPHICTLYDIGSHEGTTYLVMEHLAGESLAERLLHGPLPLAQALDIGAQIAEALDAAHKHGIIHRDLKPGNVMLTAGGAGRSGVPSAKLLDFGLAKLAAHGERPALESGASIPTRADPVTAEGTILGTLHYMAPEQLEGKEADARTDLWALGAILYEMVTGRRAFEGESQVSLIGNIMNVEPAPISTLLPLTPPGVSGSASRSIETIAGTPRTTWPTSCGGFRRRTARARRPTPGLGADWVCGCPWWAWALWPAR